MKNLVLASSFALFLALKTSAVDAPPLRVALFDDAGSTGKGVPKMKEHLAKAPGFAVTVVKGEQIRDGVL